MQRNIITILSIVLFVLLGSECQAKLTRDQKRLAEQQYETRQALIDQARAQLEAGNYAAVLDTIERLRSADPAWVEADEMEARSQAALALKAKIERLLAQGQSAYGKKNYTAAAQAYSEVLELDPANAEAARYLELSRRIQAGIDEAASAVVPEATPTPTPVVKPAPKDVSITVSLKNLSQAQATVVEAALEKVRHVRAVNLLQNSGSQAIFKVTGAEKLKSEAIGQALESISDPKIQVQPVREDFVSGRVLTPVY